MPEVHGLTAVAEEAVVVVMVQTRLVVPAPRTVEEVEEVPEARMSEMSTVVVVAAAAEQIVVRPTMHAPGVQLALLCWRKCCLPPSRRPTAVGRAVLVVVAPTRSVASERLVVAEEARLGPPSSEAAVAAVQPFPVQAVGLMAAKTEGRHRPLSSTVSVTLAVAVLASCR